MSARAWGFATAVMLGGCDLVFTIRVAPDAAPDTAIDTPAVDCVDPYQRAGDGCYRLVYDAALSFQAKEIECEAEDAHLPVITDPTEANTLYAFVTANTPGMVADYVWIGLTAARTGAFQWVTVENAPIPTPGLPPWRGGEPVDPATQPCALLDITGPQLITTTCGNGFDRVCERDMFRGDPTRY